MDWIPNSTMPGHFDLDQLMALATGEDIEAARQHAGQCAQCAQIVAEYSRLDRRLRPLLLRSACPSPLTLGELVLGMLETGEALAIRGHLVECRMCAEELRQLGADLAGDPLADAVPAPGPIRRLLARLLPAPVPGLAAAGLRGDGRNDGQAYEADGMTVSLSTQAEGSGDARSWTLLGLVDLAGVPPEAGCEVRAVAGGNVVAGGAVDEFGSFAVPGLPAGTYNLELRCADRELVVEGVSVGDAE